MMSLDDKLKNYYEILEVPYDSSFEKIHEGYIRAKNAYSGDSVALYSIMTKEEYEQMLELIETAYSVLSIPSKRREYDKVRGIHHEIPQSRSEGPSTPFMVEKMASVSDRPLLTNFKDPTELPGMGSPTTAPSPQAEETLNRTLNNFTQGKDFQINRNEVEISRISACKRFRLEYVKDPQFEQEIENAVVFTGPLLKKIREYKNVTLERMADLTKISKTYLLQIEKDDVEKLPALAYVRGFVYQVAKVLKLGPELVANSYLTYLKDVQKKKKDLGV